MTGCADASCCSTWSFLLRVFNAGRKLEASIEAKRRVAAGEDVSCKFRLRAIKQMTEEGWIE